MKFGICFLLLMTMVGTGCIKARQPAPTEQDSATFGVGRVSAVSKIGQRGSWQIPTSYQYDMSACFQDLATVTALRGAEFSVVSSESEIKIKTNQEGCANWTEEIRFQPLLPAQTILFKRVIKGLGTQSGQRSIDFAANPWDALTGQENGSRLMDLRFEKLPDSKVIGEVEARTAKSVELSGVAKIFVDALKLTFQQVGSSGSQPVVTIDTTTNLSLILTDRFNRTSNFPLQNAEARIELYFGYRSQQTKDAKPQLLMPYNQPLKIQARFENGGLKGRAEMKLSQLPSSGELLAYLRVIPLKTPDYLLPYEAVFTLGDATSFTGSSMGQLVESNAVGDKPFSIEDALKPSQTIPLAVQKPAGARGIFTPTEQQESLRTLETYTFAPFTFQFAGFRSDESAGQRTVVYKVKTTVKSTLTGSPLLYQKFNIKKTDGQNVSITSTDSGVIEWTEELKHQYYDREKYMARQVVLSANDGFSKTIEFYINPWDNSATFGFDQRLGKNLQLLNAEIASRLNATVALIDFGYQSQNLKYDIDPYLNMAVRKSLIFNFAPKAIRTNSLSKGKAAIEDLRDGVYVLRAALQKKYFEDLNTPVEFISVVERLVRVQQGKINAPLEFKIRDLRLMRTRMNFLVEIAPVNEKLYANLKDLEDLKIPSAYTRAGQLIDRTSDLKPRTYVGPVVIGNDMGGGPLRPTDQLEENLCAVSDCNTLQKVSSVSNESFTNAQLSQYSQSVKSLKGETLNAVIERWQKSENAYVNQMNKSSSLERYLIENNLEYTQLSGHQSMLAKITTQELTRTNLILGSENPMAKFLNKINITIKASNGAEIQQSSTAEMRNFIATRDPSPVLARRICRFMLDEIYFEKATAKGLDINNGLKNQRTQLLNECYKAAVEKRLGQFFALDRVIRSQQLNSFEEGVGRWVNFNLGSQVNIGFAKSHSDSKTISGGLNISGMAYDLVSDALQKIPIVGAIAKGVSFSVSQSKTDSLNYNTGSAASLNSGIALAVQQKTIKLNFSKVERCLSIKVASSTWEKFRASQILLKRLPRGDVANWMSRGLFLCTGETENKPISVNEDYYYFSQYFSSGDMLDDADLKNNPWLLMVRGQQDYLKLLGAMDVRGVNYSQDKQSYGKVGATTVPQNYDLASDATLRLDSAFKDRSATYPKMLILR